MHADLALAVPSATKNTNANANANANTNADANMNSDANANAIMLMLVLVLLLLLPIKVATTITIVTMVMIVVATKITTYYSDLNALRITTATQSYSRKASPYYLSMISESQGQATAFPGTGVCQAPGNMCTTPGDLKVALSLPVMHLNARTPKQNYAQHLKPEVAKP